MASSTAGIPIIDLAPLESPSLREAEATAAELYEALKKVGFAYIKNHGVPQHTVDEAFEWVWQVPRRPGVCSVPSDAPRGPFDAGRAASSLRCRRASRTRRRIRPRGGTIAATRPWGARRRRR